MTNAAPATGNGIGEGVMLPKRQLMLVFVALLLGTFMSALDQMIVSTALPTIVGELGGVNHMAWVTTGYILAATVSMPVFGKLGDLIGRKWLYVAALVLFLAGSIASALSGDMAGFILGRAVQGLGGGGLLVLSHAIIADIVAPRYRGRYMGIMGGVFTLTSVLGPVVGGWLTSGPGWRWAFWINVPLALLAILASVALLPNRHAVVARPRMDIAGVVTMVVAVSSTVLISAWGGSLYRWASPQIAGLAVVAIVAGVTFVASERRAEVPLIPLHLFANRNFNIATGVSLLISIAMFGTTAYMPTYLQIVEALTPAVAGYLMVPFSVGIFITATGSGFMAARTGRYKWMPIASCALSAASLLLLSSLTLGTPIAVIGADMMVLGLAIGLSVQTLVLVSQNEFSIAEVGTATSTFSFFREIGASLGSALVGSLFTAGLSARLAEQLAPLGGTSVLGVNANSLTPQIADALPEAVRHAVALAYNEAFTPVLMGLVPMMALGFVAMLFLQETPLRTTNEPFEALEAGESAA